MKFNTALKMFVVITASSAKYIHAGGQSIVVDDTSKTTMPETLLVDGGGRFDDINNLRQTVVDPVTRADASSSKTDTMRNTVVDAAASDFLLKTLPVDSGGRFSPTRLNNLHHTVVGPIIGDVITSFSGNANHRAVDLSVADVQSKPDLSTASDGSLVPPRGIIDPHAVVDAINDDDEISSSTGVFDRGVAEDALGSNDVQQSIHDLFSTSDGSLIPPSDTVNHHADGGSIFAIPHHRELEATCSDYGLDDEDGGDCSANPTYCVGSDENIVECWCNDPDPFFPIMMESEEITGSVSCNSAARYDQTACGGCSGSCVGRNHCLNLDFHCAEGQACELWCSGENTCKKVTMHCPDNQVCKIQNCGDGTERCVGAKVKCGSGTVAVGNFACEPFLYKYEIMSVLENIGTSILGGTGSNKYGAIFEINFEHSTELCLNDCYPDELKVSVFNSYNEKNQCEGNAFDSTNQTVTVIDGSFLQDGDMPHNNNGKISMIEVTFDDVFEADITSSSVADGLNGVDISLCIRVETTDGMHMFDKIDIAIIQFIELNGEITTSKLGVANFDTESKILILDDGTLKVEGIPEPYMCHDEVVNSSLGTVAVGEIMNICVPGDEKFRVDYIKNLICSNGDEYFNLLDNADGSAVSYFSETEPDSEPHPIFIDGGLMIGIEIKAEYLPANSGISRFECSGIIVYYYVNGERRLTPRQLQDSMVEEPEAKFSLMIMITNEDPIIGSSGTNMAAISLSTLIVTLFILKLLSF